MTEIPAGSVGETFDAPVLVLVDLETPRASAAEAVSLLAPSRAGLALVAGAAALTRADVVALALGPVGADASAALAGAGATRVLAADLGQAGTQAGVVADALVSAVRTVKPAVALVLSDYHGKEVAARAAVLLGSACTADASDLRVREGALTASKTVLSGSWSTTLRIGGAGTTPVVAVRAPEVEVPGPAAPVAVEALDVVLTPESLAVRVVSREPAPTASGPDLAGARTVVVAGRGVGGDIDLVRSLADPLGAAVGATRVVCDEGWLERSAQVGQTGVSIAPRLYIGLGVSGAIHHTSGIQGAGTVVAVCDDAEAPIFQMADFGVVGDVTTVVPQLVEELDRLRA
ncbi:MULTISPECIES: electron transfer flavoprotein subunit alpha/FixB family protein [Actinomyces]|uniref:Electron transfer flavoprotein subunit alpha/FixB family protein n=1 Tax=Actinomyces respiraculi TaxID=2744574 RepID=A0A7T0LLJ4_9ACTO|nr:MULTISPECIES: FAD-binding protein [Actinomyces]QPL05992.1 electron transfer flavoprotein subunit alpha/FixB family protein [Actinomyces respiraculi]